MSGGGGTPAVRMVIAGRVQGVGFRYFTRQVARELGLVGWVKNLPSGEVEVRVTGEPALLEKLRGRLRQGPPGARVDRLDETELEAAEPWREFRITF